MEASRPTRARGLKLTDDQVKAAADVAPHTGAWIETFGSPIIRAIFSRAPHGRVD